jgi:hypothetical protein
MCASVTWSRAEILYADLEVCVADVIVPDPFRVTVRAMVTDPLAPASALVVAGTSFAAVRGTVNVDEDVVVPCDGVVGVSEQPAMSTLRPMMSAESRFMWFSLPCECSLRRMSWRD